MAEQISYFEAASYLADIEAEYADITDTTKRTSELVVRLQEQWAALTVEQAVAYIRLFSETRGWLSARRLH